MKTSVTQKPTKAIPSGPDRWQNQRVMFCGHQGWFLAEVIVTRDAIVVIAEKPVRPDKLVRTELESATWHISDEFPGQYWSPTNGRFVLNRDAVTRL